MARGRRAQPGIAISGLLVAGLIVGSAIAIGSRNVAEPVSRVQPEGVAEGAWTPLEVTITAGAHAIRKGTITLSIPSGWPQPATSPASAGHVTSSAGTLAVHGRSVTVRAVDLLSAARLTITYGGGKGGATEPMRVGGYAFTLSVSAGGASATRTLWVRVDPSWRRCRTNTDPVGAGRPLILTNGIAQPNMYNARATAGVVRQCYTRAGLSTTIALKNVSPIAPGPIGYPEAAYGYHLYGQPFCGPCRTRVFPLLISTMRTSPNAYRVAATYSLSTALPTSLPRDFIYDLWLERKPSPGTPPRPGDVELIIVLYHAGTDSPCARLGRTASLLTQASVDGLTGPTRWLVCRISGGTPATAVAFLPSSPSASRARSISLSLTAFIDAAGRLLGADLGHHKLMGIELGGEVDRCVLPTGCVASSVDWSWQLSRLTFTGPDGAIPIVISANR